MQTQNDGHSVDPHTQIILDRYADRQNIQLLRTDPTVLIERYLSKVMTVEQIKDKTILELGAGGSQYVPVFLGNGCKRYYANDIIPERLKVVRVDDSRFVEMPGDFRDIELPEPVDIVFANLTMMFLQPMLNEFVPRIRDSLKKNGIFLGCDPNYICPLSIYRRFADRGANPARVFNPFRYAKAFQRHGFEVEKLVPLTAAYPWTTGNWLLGTSFWLRSRKL